jgi:hypothetical protein
MERDNEVVIYIDSSEPRWCFGMKEFRNHQCQSCELCNECSAVVDELMGVRERGRESML